MEGLSGGRGRDMISDNSRGRGRDKSSQNMEIMENTKSSTKLIQLKAASFTLPSEKQNGWTTVDTKSTHAITKTQVKIKQEMLDESNLYDLLSGEKKNDVMDDTTLETSKTTMSKVDETTKQGDNETDMEYSVKENANETISMSIDSKIRKVGTKRPHENDNNGESGKSLSLT